MSFITNIPFRNQQNILKNFDNNVARKGKILREMSSGSKINTTQDKIAIYGKPSNQVIIGDVKSVDSTTRGKIADDVEDNWSTILTRIEQNQQILKKYVDIYKKLIENSPAGISGEGGAIEGILNASGGYFGTSTSGYGTTTPTPLTVNGEAVPAQSFHNLSFSAIMNRTVSNYSSLPGDRMAVLQGVYNGIQYALENDAKLKQMQINQLQVAREQLGEEISAQESQIIADINSETASYAQIVRSYVQAVEASYLNSEYSKVMYTDPNNSGNSVYDKLNAITSVDEANAALISVSDKITEAAGKLGKPLITGFSGNFNPDKHYSTLEFNAGTYGTFKYEWASAVYSLNYDSQIKGILQESTWAAGLGATDDSKKSKQAILDRIKGYDFANEKALKNIKEVLYGLIGDFNENSTITKDDDRSILVKRNYYMQDLMYETLRKNDAYFAKNEALGSLHTMKEALESINMAYRNMYDFLNDSKLTQASFQYSYDNNEFMANALESMAGVAHNLLENTYYHNRKLLGDSNTGSVTNNFTISTSDGTTAEQIEIGTNDTNYIDVKMAFNGVLTYELVGDLLRNDQYYSDFTNTRTGGGGDNRLEKSKVLHEIDRMKSDSAADEEDMKLYVLIKTTIKDMYNTIYAITVNDTKAPDKPINNPYIEKFDMQEYNNEIIKSMKEIMKYQSITELTMTANEQIREQYSSLVRLMNQIETERDEESAETYQNEFNKILEHIDQIQNEVKFSDLNIFSKSGDYYKKINFEIFGFNSIGYTLKNHSSETIFPQNDKKTIIKNNFNNFLNLIDQYKASAEKGINVSDYNDKILMGTYTNLSSIDSILFKKSEGISTIVGNFENVDVQDELTKLQQSETFEALNDFVFSSIRENLKKMVEMVKI